MKKLSVLCLFTLCLMALPATVQAGFDPNEILSNWSFEDANPNSVAPISPSVIDQNLPDYFWSWQQGSAGSGPVDRVVYLEEDDVNAFHGDGPNDCMRVDNGSSPSWAGFSQAIIDDDYPGYIMTDPNIKAVLDANIVAGDTYTVSIYARSQNHATGSGFEMKLEFYSDPNGVHGDAGSGYMFETPKVFQITDQWRNYDNVFVVPGPHVAKIIVSNAAVGFGNPITTKLDDSVYFDVIGMLPGGALSDCDRARSEAYEAAGWFPVLPGDIAQNSYGETDCTVLMDDAAVMVDQWLNCNDIDLDCSN